MPIHKLINTVAGKQRRRNRRRFKEIGSIVIFIAKSFLDIFNLSFI
jgi:hypothetical protein